MANGNSGMMTFGEHLEVFRSMLLRIIAIIVVFGAVIFCCKDITFGILFAPNSSEFITYRIIEDVCRWLGIAVTFEPYSIQMINTELSSQFMTHLSTSVYLALLLASPFILAEALRFITPALYENERKYSARITITIFALFATGILMSYFVIFPFSIRFLGTYQVSSEVVNMINLSSYISTFTTLTFLMGIVFQIPVISFFLAKMGILQAEFMAKYRRHALILILIIAAVITPPDVFTLILVTMPMYALYEVSILIVKRITNN
ncbi:MAG: twin-arginine translocase subunit TatC [Prevotella sp.]|nr:twin-arginine translocase subunit TatC [Prevotella sp.]